MSDITPFMFPTTGQSVRTLLVDGEAWVVAADVAAILGYANGNRDVNRHVPERHRRGYRIGTPYGEQQMTIISEPGVYRLVMRSNQAQAEAFQDWLAEEVIPTIRRTGSYGASREMTRLELIDLARESELARIDAESRAVCAEQQVLALTPKAEAHDAFLVAAQSDRTVGQVAKLLDMRECDLRGFLLDEKLIFVRRRACDGSREYNYMAANKAHFTQVETRVHHEDLSHNHFTLYVTPRGIDLIRKRTARQQAVGGVA